MTRRLLLHLAGPGAEPFPDVAAAVRMARNAHGEMPDAVVEIVVQGPAVRQLAADGKHAGDIATLAGNPGLSIAACANSLRSAGMIPGALAEGVVVVPAAVAHLAQRQYEGTAYVRV